MDGRRRHHGRQGCDIRQGGKGVEVLEVRGRKQSREGGGV